MKLANLLLLATLGACGAPGTDAVFTKGNPKIDQKGAVGAGPAKAAPQPPPQRIETKKFVGVYRRTGEESLFQVCGAQKPMDVFGPPEPRQVLHERFRFGTVWQGMKMYAEFQGAIVTDTMVTKPDTVPTVRTRFFLAKVDTIRPWESRDCGGMRVN